ncbi:hypothetical protein CTH30272_00938 [Allocatenococcus thiocycli]|nr:hypothetical protein CTH30272_00938 [Catenococcus thiocycli]
MLMALSFLRLKYLLIKELAMLWLDLLSRGDIFRIYRVQIEKISLLKVICNEI